MIDIRWARSGTPLECRCGVGSLPGFHFREILASLLARLLLSLQVRKARPILGSLSPGVILKSMHGQNKNIATSQRCQYPAITLRWMKLTERNTPPDTHILHISDLFAGHLRSGQSRDLPHYKLTEGNTVITHFVTGMI